MRVGNAGERNVKLVRGKNDTPKKHKANKADEMRRAFTLESSSSSEDGEVERSTIARGRYYEEPSPDRKWDDEWDDRMEDRPNHCNRNSKYVSLVISYTQSGQNFPRNRN